MLCDFVADPAERERENLLNRWHNTVATYFSEFSESSSPSGHGLMSKSLPKVQECTKYEDVFMSNGKIFALFYESFMSRLGPSRATSFLCAGAVGFLFSYESRG